MSKRTIIEHFSVVYDPRVKRGKKHKLVDIIVLSICGLICDCDSWTEIEEFCKFHELQFKQFLELENGIPSHDTFGRVFSLINPENFQKIFMDWVEETFRIEGPEQIAVDGKMIRSLDKNGYDRISFVSGWGCGSRAVLAQVRATRGTEKLGFEQLLGILEIKDCVISMDAAGCSAKLSKVIIDKKGDYLIALKGNNKTTLEEVQSEFDKGIEINKAVTQGRGHGRQETRACETIALSDKFLKELKHRTNDREVQWVGLKSACRVHCVREVNGELSKETRYYITSLEPDAERLLGHVRNHWGIENSLHYVLDAAFDEDRMKTRNKMGVENTVLVRKMALNLLKKDQTSKSSIKGRRKRAAWDFEYLIKILKINGKDEASE